MPQRFPGSDIVIFAALIAIILSDGLSPDDISILSGLFNAIGENLDVIAAKKQACGNNDSDESQLFTCPLTLGSYFPKLS